jgi:hypothetical protein
MPYSVSLALFYSFLMIPSSILVRNRKSRLGLPAYPLFALFDFLFGISVISRTILEIIFIVDRNRRHSTCQDKAEIGINAGLLFEQRTRQIFLNNPVRIQIEAGLKWLAVFIKFAISRIMLTSGLIDFSLLIGRLGDLTILLLTARLSLIVRPWDSNWRRLPEFIWSINFYESFALFGEHGVLRGTP